MHLTRELGNGLYFGHGQGQEEVKEASLEEALMVELVLI